ncbi:MAG: dihydrolipoamide acetyltransferase family protein [Bacteroidota bacterium]|nr:dihydrolipoamide acetyltransferase family protein [Bacteroidota bacterium]
MAQVEMVMPKMGESIIEATIIRWLKKEGERVEKDEPLLEVATDKVDTEVPATESGILQKIVINEGQIAKIGASIAVLETNGQQIAIANKVINSPVQQIETEIKKISSEISSDPKSSSINRFYSPLVLNIAREEQISMVELEKIEGTGKDNRVTKYDIINYVENRKKAPETKKQIIDNQAENRTIAQTPNVDVITPTETFIEPKKEIVSTKSVNSGVDEIIEMDRMRKIIAQRMIDSQKISAHVTSFVEVDVTNIVSWRGKIKHEFMNREGEGITFTPMFVEAVSRALRDFPLVNSSVDGDKIIIKKDINIGIAVALQDGNLIVPVIRNADRYNIVGLTKSVNEIVKKARNNKLTPDDVSGGTYAISNIGNFGNVMGTPIIVQPQVAIMAFGAIRKKPAVIETEHGDTIGVRHMMYISHTYDHRIIDGALGGSFARKVADYLEGFDPDRKLM